MQDSTASISLIANLSLVPAVAQHIPSRACFGGIKIAMCAGIANRPRAVQELTYSNRIPRALLNKHCMTSRLYVWYDLDVVVSYYTALPYTMW